MGFAWLPVFVVLASADPPARAPEPQPCTRWQGTASGNDPSVAITATLCELGDHRLSGSLVWQSARSGWNLRAVEGTRSQRALVLRDTELTGTPEPGWVFCKIDRYQLAASDDDHLAGRYHSSACRDDASITLVRVR